MIRSTLTRAKCPHCGNEIMTAETNVYNAEPVHRCYCGGEIVDGRCRDCGALMIDMSHFSGNGNEPTMIKLSVGGTSIDMFGIMRVIGVKREIAPIPYADDAPFMTMTPDDSVKIKMLMERVYMRRY